METGDEFGFGFRQIEGGTVGFGDRGDEEEQEPMTEALLAVMGNPELFDLMMRSGQGETVDQKEIFRLMGQNPRISGVVINALQKAGHLDLGLLGSPSIKQPPPRSRPRITGKRKKRR